MEMKELDPRDNGRRKREMEPLDESLTSSHGS
jgi:hypothetical protein